MVLLAAGFLMTRRGGTESAGGEIFLEPVSQSGPAPFTAPVASPPPAPVPTPDPTAPETTLKAGSTTAIRSTSGSRPGLYGGTRNNASCDKPQLIAFLQQQPDKAAAFAAVVGIAATDVPAFINGLTPVLLRGDTRVTNHGFTGGKATPRQAVLQAGTAVLSDNLGVPRARCACGNPLSPPTAVSTSPAYTGKAWPGFSPKALDVVAPAPAPIEALVLADDVANTSFSRPVGTDGAADGPPGPPIPDPTPAPATTTTAGTSTPTTGSTATTSTTTDRDSDVPQPNTDVTAQGRVQASTTFSPEFSASLAVDGDPSTSWLSGTSGRGGISVFTWTGTADDLLTEVRIKLDARGFGSVAVEVLDEFGDPDFSETAQLPGSPDPEVVVRPGVQGRTVRLTFRGHEDPTRGGGIAELHIGATR
ncbi:MAG TPA: discoidin domain-containing protein [Acidimicrobiales bacterium]|nr:discoidin domain-containing protein [Acidimicrobiales bacterium]